MSTCEQIEPTFATLAQSADLISPYGTAFRYPPFIAGPTDLDALEALDATRDALTFVLVHLPDSVHP